MLDLRQLAVLRAIERTGSLAAAARDLHVSQPTVAHHLDALERSLGTHLVQRGPRGATLTDLGVVLWQHADAIWDRLASAESEVRSLARAGVATLRVGTFASAGAVLLPGALATVQRRTGVRVELREAETPELLDALADGSLHAALLYVEAEEALPLAEGWQAVHLLDDPYRVALPADHPLAQQEQVALADLADEGWILSHQAHDVADLELIAAAARAGFTPRPVLRTDDFHVASGFIAAGLGVTLIPELAAEPRAGVVLRPVAGEHLARRIELARPIDPLPVVDLLARALTRLAERRRATAPS